MFQHVLGMKCVNQAVNEDQQTARYKLPEYRRDQNWEVWCVEVEILDPEDKEVPSYRKINFIKSNFIYKKLLML